MVFLRGLFNTRIATRNTWMFLLLCKITRIFSLTSYLFYKFVIVKKFPCHVHHITRSLSKYQNGYQINSSTKEISDLLQEIRLPIDHVLVNLDVTSLYTKVPVLQAIEHYLDLLYSGKYKEPPVNRATFVELLKFAAPTWLCKPMMGTYNKMMDLQWEVHLHHI